MGSQQSSSIKLSQGRGYTSSELRKISDVVNYAKSISGCKHKSWVPGMKLMVNSGPFWSLNSPAPDPSLVKNSSANCLGFLNLLMRKAGQPIPGVKENDEYGAGGSPLWIGQFKKNNVLQPLDVGMSYPAGTLVIRARQFDDDYAIIIDENKNILCQQIIHCYSNQRDGSDPGITEGEKMGLIHYGWGDKTGFYDHIIRPENWILI